MNEVLTTRILSGCFFCFGLFLFLSGCFNSTSFTIEFRFNGATEEAGTRLRELTISMAKN